MLKEIERQVIDNVAIGISVFSYKNNKLNLIWANKELEKLFGIDRNKINEYNNTPTPFLHPEDKIIIEDSLRNITKNKNEKFSARYYNYNTKQYYNFQAEANITFLEDNSLKIYVTYKDNSFFASHFSNLELYNNNLLQKLGIAIWRYDVEEKKVYDYRNFMGYRENMLNHKKEIENVPKCIIDEKIIHPEDIKTYENLYNDLFLGKIENSCDIRIYFDNIHDYKWVRMNYHVFINPLTNVKEIIGTMKDIHNKKTTDNIINFVVQNEFDYLVRADYKRNKYLVYFNNSKENTNFQKKFTLTLKQFEKLISIDIKAAENLYKKEKITLKNIFKDIKILGSFKRYYKIYNHKNELRTKEIKISNVNLKHGIFYIIRRDITDVYNENERKNKALKEALALAENANKTKTTFLASMSHDIKTPMNAIIGMTDLTYNAIGVNNEQVKENLNVIKASSKNLLNIINEVLDMNKVNSGKIKFQLKEFKLDSLATSTLKNFIPIADIKNQKIYSHFNMKNNLLIGDTSSIIKVSNALIENAIKYTPNNGRIDVYINEIYTKKKEGLASFEIKVKDNGIGISKEDQLNIFKPFHRGENIGNTKGTGLGLPIVKGILNLRGSDIKVQSEIGKGTTFIIEISFKTNIDIKNNNSLNDSTKEDNNLKLKNKKILLVEDNEINRLVARKNLEKYNIIVEEAVNGKEGYEKFINSSKNYYSLVIMDIRMPLMNGIECTKKIRNSLHENNNLPILALSANTFTEDRRKCFEAGMNDYMPKPIDPLLLKDLIVKHIK